VPKIGGLEIGKVAAMNEPHSMLIYGLPKRGKTSLACSIIDVDGFDNVLLIDAEEGAGAAAFDYPDVDHVTVTSGSEWDGIMDALLANEDGMADHYDAVIVDTLSTIQRWVTDELAGGKKPERDDWAGTYEFMMKGMWAMHRMKPVGITLVHTLTREDKAKEAVWTKPWIQGSGADTIGNVPDLMGYLDVRAASGGMLNRTLQLQPKETMIVGNRYEKILPPVMINPTMSDIYAAIRGAGLSE